MSSEARGDAGQPTMASTSDLAASISSLTNVVEKGIGKVIATYDLTTVEFNCLWFCLDREKETTVTELASRLPVDASRVSRVVTTLVDKGLLIRRRLRSDRRVVMLRPSDEGKELARQIHQSVDLFVASLAEGISERDLRGFASVASTIVANHDAMTQPE